MAYVPAEKRKDFVERVLQENPTAAIDNINEIRMFLPRISSQVIIENAKADGSRISFMPKTLTEIFKIAEKEKNPERRSIILKRGGEIYHIISEIRNSKLGESYNKIQDKNQITAREEEDLLATFYCFAMLKEDEIIDEGKLGNSLQESRQILFERLSKRIKSDLDIDSSSIDRFSAAMGSAAPFLTYYLQYEDLHDYQIILKEIFESITIGKFEEWKFGENTPENLEILKKKGYLPKNLTIEQYQIWRKDEETSIYDILASDAKTIATEIRKILLNNNEEHLQVESFFEMESISELKEILEKINKELQSLGKILGHVNKEFWSLKKKENKEELSELEIFFMDQTFVPKG